MSQIHASPLINVLVVMAAEVQEYVIGMTLYVRPVMIVMTVHYNVSMEYAMVLVHVRVDG